MWRPRVRTEIAAPLIEQATADGATYLTARERMWEATVARDRAGRIGKRGPDRVATGAAGEHDDTEETVRRRRSDWPSAARTNVGRGRKRSTAERAQTARDERAAKLAQFHSPSIDHERPRPERDHGLGL